MANFIHKQYKKEPILIRIDFEKLEKVDKFAGIYHVSRSEFISQCIDYALDHIPELQKEAAEE